jgi:hypothetical protein
MQLKPNNHCACSLHSTAPSIFPATSGPFRRLSGPSPSPPAVSMQSVYSSPCEMRMLMKAFMWMVLACMLVGCAFIDARTAHTAQQRLIGWSELDLEKCLGAPDQHCTFGDTDILTYFGNSTSNTGISLGLPFIAGMTIGGGGYCHAIFTVREGRVAEVRYSGETNAALAPDAYCAPIVRGCVHQAEHFDVSPPSHSR